MIPDLLPLKPYLRETVWGGRSLGTYYNKALPPDVPIGESWEVSAYKGMESIVADGPLAGQNLADLVAIYGADLLGQRVIQRYGTEFPLLIKLLDARDDLSIQVHPDDTYTRAENLGTYGKTEAWYILKSDQGRVACGLKHGVDKHSLELSIRENRLQDTVQFFDVQEGDVIFVPPGTVHALCQNVMIYEVQQSSDLTFRIYDYNRPGTDGKPRELHIDRALDVIAFDAPAARTATLEPSRNRHKLPHSSGQKTPNTSASNASPLWTPSNTPITHSRHSPSSPVRLNSTKLTQLKQATPSSSRPIAPSLSRLKNRWNI